MSIFYCVECGREMEWRGKPHYDHVCPKHGHTSFGPPKKQPFDTSDYPEDTQTPSMFEGVEG